MNPDDSDRYELEVMAELWEKEQFDPRLAKWCKEVDAKIDQLTKDENATNK